MFLVFLKHISLHKRLSMDFPLWWKQLLIAARKLRKSEWLCSATTAFLATFNVFCARMGKLEAVKL